ncbi:MAG: FAD-dependent oxidoreductase [Dissulfurispiraceae bacterium]
MRNNIFSYWNGKYTEGAFPLNYRERPVAAIIGWGGIQVFHAGVDLIELCAEYAKAVQNSSCGQCIPCRTGMRVLADLFSKMRDGLGEEGDLESIKNLSRTISKASMCEIGQSSPRVFLYLLEHFGEVFRTSLKSYRKSERSYGFYSLLTAPCMQACPIHLDIPKYVEDIKVGRFKEALEVIKSRLPIPGIVGRVCVRPCEFHCRRGLVDGSVQIKHLKRFVADCALELDRSRDKNERTANSGSLEQTFSEGPQQMPSPWRVAIIGAGPAGLTCAYFLAKKGYDVTIFEMLPEPGGMAAVGIPDYRLPREIVRYEADVIQKLGVQIMYGKALGPHFTLDDLEQEGYRAVFIGMGCHCHKSLGIEGEDKGYIGYVPGVYFLRNINLGLLGEVPKGKKMVVIGGGNVAIDCVRIAFRVGFEESHIVYRRSRKEMPADSVEVDDAEEEGVQFHFLTAPKRIVAEAGKVMGLECLRMELGAPDTSGRRKPLEVQNSEFVIDADVIVAAIGQEGDFNCMCNLPGVEVTDKGAIIVDENLMTTRKGVFAGGDCVTGPDVLIRACAHGRRVGLAIDKFLTEGKMETINDLADEKFLDQLQVFDAAEIIDHPGGVERTPIKNELPLERKKDFREVDHGFTTNEAVSEASRCLRCYRVVMYAYEEGQNSGTLESG